jgi:hypothetical protein
MELSTPLGYLPYLSEIYKGSGILTPKNVCSQTAASEERHEVNRRVALGLAPSPKLGLLNTKKSAISHFSVHVFGWLAGHQNVQESSKKSAAQVPIWGTSLETPAMNRRRPPFLRFWLEKSTGTPEIGIPPAGKPSTFNPTLR